MTGSTSSKVTDTTGGNEVSDQIEVLAEFKLALCALSAAVNFATPWNRSADAIVGFMEQCNYCQSELGGKEQQARTLTRFVNYILEENANRWREKQSFVSTGEMKEAWSSFYSTLPSQAASSGKRSHFQQKGFAQQQPMGHQKQWTGSMPIEKAQYYDDICVKWNQGRCFMNPGNCFTRAGRPLRHCCNYRPVPNNPAIICQKDHACCYFHR